MIIRDANVEDSKAIASLYNHYIRLGKWTMETDSYTVATMASRITNLRPREAMLVLEDQDQINGWGTIRTYSDRAGYRFTCEIGLFIRDGLTGNGIGPLLLQAVIDRCNKIGYHHVHGKVWVNNKSSLSMLSKMGFKQIGIQPQVGFRNGEWVDVMIVALVLEEVQPKTNSSPARAKMNQASN